MYQQLPFLQKRRNPHILSINGVSVLPSILYEARKASPAGWNPTVGEALSPNSVGGVTFSSEGIDSVKFDGTGYFTAPNNTLGDIANEDIVIEMVWYHIDETKVIASKSNGLNEGWRLISNGSSMTLQIEGTNAVQGSVSISPSVDNWNHGIWFVDRSGSGVAYLNTVAGTPAGLTLVTSLANSAVFTIGKLSGAEHPANHGLSFLALWKRDNWLDTHLQEAVALERFTRWVG